MAKNITVIPATRNQHTGIPTMTKYKRRVADAGYLVSAMTAYYGSTLEMTENGYTLK